MAELNPNCNPNCNPHQAQVETGEKAEALRQIHLANNAEYAQFIVGQAA